MPEKDTICRDIARRSLLFSLMAALAGVALARPLLPYLTGLLLGSVVSLLHFRLLHLTLSRAVHMPPGRAQKYTTMHYLFRYLLTALVLLVSIRSPLASVWGTALGLLAIKPAILSHSLFNEKDYFRNIIFRKEEK